MRKLLCHLVIIGSLSAWAQPPNLPWDVGTSPEYHGARIRETVVKTTRLGPHRNIPVRVYLPPAYNSNGAQRYPVLYVVDGQNMFSPDAGDWELDEHLEKLIGRGAMRPIIAVAIDTANGDIRANYMPSLGTFNPKGQKEGGRAEELVQFVMDLKKDIDHDFKTLPSDTALMGSSLGGLFAIHEGFKYPQVFRRVAALSPSIWWGNRPRNGEGESLVSDAQAKRGPARLWVDVGDNEFSDHRDPVAVQQKEAQDNVNFASGFDHFVRANRPANAPYRFEIYRDSSQDGHNEFSWSNRLDDVLPWLFR